MKRWSIWMFACFVGMSACTAASESTLKCAAILPNGTTIELIGLRNYSIRDLEKFKDRIYPWWKPDGTVLAEPPDTGRGRTSTTASYWLVIRVEGDTGSDFKAVGPYGDDLTVQHVRRKAPGFEKDDLRYFSLRFSPDQTQGDIKLGVASGDWETVDRWSIDPDWTPYNLNIGSSDQLILRCPEQVGSDVVAEVTQIVTERSTRLVLFDQDGNQYESEGEIGGKGEGLIRHVHRFRDFDRKNIEHIEFQVRPYQYWITFRNVSLQAKHKTEIKVDIQQPGVLLKGNILPGFDGIEFDSTLEDIEGRMLLICFFDLNQRPSRRCITEIAKEAETLKEKGIPIIAVQAAKIHRERLDEWIRSNNIPFSVGIIAKDVEKLRFTWGIRSLPWLILANNQHNVIGSGFSLTDLGKKIKTAN